MNRQSTRTYRAPFSLAARVPISPLAHRSLSIRLAKATFFNLLFWLTLIATLTACLAVCNS